MNSKLSGFWPRAIGSIVVALSCAALALALGACSTTNSSSGSAKDRALKDFQIPSGFVQIQPGTFQMGSVDGDRDREKPVHAVTISYPFLMGAKEVTQAEYEGLMGKNPSHFQGSEYPDSGNRPVEKVTWHDARSYCAALTAKQSALGAVPAGYEYRLPTEAEWEYACRAGTTTEWNVGDALKSSDANYKDGQETRGVWIAERLRKSGGQTAVVGSYAPNAWGLFDMHGNVWEWCLDSYADYPSSAVTDPFVTGGPYRDIRGGSWNSRSNLCRSAIRSSDDPGCTDDNFGFRVVLAPVLVP